jgi:hypothetical protein
MHHYGTFREGTGSKPGANRDRQCRHCIEGRNAVTKERDTQIIPTSTLLRGQNQVPGIRPANTDISIGRQPSAPQTNRHARAPVLQGQGYLGRVLPEGGSRSSLPPLRRGQAYKRHKMPNGDHGDFLLYG